VNHLTDPVTGEADPRCICRSCLLVQAHAALKERRALNRILRDMAQPHCQRGPWNYKPGHADDATCQRLREFFDADQ